MLSLSSSFSLVCSADVHISGNKSFCYHEIERLHGVLHDASELDRGQRFVGTLPTGGLQEQKKILYSPTPSTSILASVRHAIFSLPLFSPREKEAIQSTRDHPRVVHDCLENVRITDTGSGCSDLAFLLARKTPNKTTRNTRKNYQSRVGFERGFTHK